MQNFNCFQFQFSKNAKAQLHGQDHNSNSLFSLTLATLIVLIIFKEI
jgi:hypothetical protein